MAECDQWFNIVLSAFIKHIVIELQSLLIGFWIITVRIDPCPVDGHAEALESHLGKQCNILLVVMVVVHCIMARVECCFIDLRQKCARRIHIAAQ